MLEREAYMWLGHLTTLRQSDIDKLFRLFGSADEIYKNLYEDRDVLRRLTEKKLLKEETELEIVNEDVIAWDKSLRKSMKETSINCVTPVDDKYPKRLLKLSDRPLSLYYRGDISLAEREHIIAIIGSRKVSQYGMIMTEEFAKELSFRGITVVSGMAYGVDGKAHRAALKARGGTIAVLGGGVDICYPRTNIDIYLEMCESQLVLSEYMPKTAHISLHFPARNRIISGLSDGVLVIEASLRSGTLITVDRALEQGRTIYAIPGRTTDIMSKGTNNLIKQGANLVDSPSDIIKDMLGIDINRRKKATRADVMGELCEPLTEKEKTILGYLGFEPVFLDDLIRNNNMNISETLTILRSLERRDLITTVDHSFYMLKKQNCC